MQLLELARYRENYRLEAKAARGGLPRSVWESYSAFANSSGGLILLGVEERADGTLVPVGVSDVSRLLDDFWNTVNNEQKVSVNVLLDEDVRVFEEDGVRIVAIEVPRANRRVKPVYLNDNPKRAFRRNHAGDYLCSYEEIQSMMRDAAAETQDARILPDTPMEHLDAATIERYRIRYRQEHEGHVWNSYEDDAFLESIGGAARDERGALHPTAAGLLMFGQDRWIIREFPHYFLDYREETDASLRWVDRFTSQDGDWSGNLFDFYYRAYSSMKQALKVPFKLEGIHRVDDTPAHVALREALANCLVNANYYERRGVVCVRGAESLSIANPGDFRMDIEDARRPGASDPRNETILRMFSMVKVGERAGSGLSKIYAGWADAGYAEPCYEEEFGPDRTVLRLPLAGVETSAEYLTIRSAEADMNLPKIEVSTEKNRQILSVDRRKEVSLSKGRESLERVYSVLVSLGEAKTAQIASEAGLKISRTNELLRRLVDSGRVIAEGSARARTYRIAPRDS